MERIIKFRAKMTDSMAESVNCDGDRWVQGFYFEQLIGGKLVSIITDGAHEFEVDESTLGQFTGLKDKNGTEIYEGDIIKYYSLKYDSGRCGGEPFITSNIHPVEFENGVFFCSNSKYHSLSQIGLFDLKQVQFVMPIYDDIDKGPFLDCAGTCANEHIIGIEVIGNIYDNPKILNKV